MKRQDIPPPLCRSIHRDCFGRCLVGVTDSRNPMGYRGVTDAEFRRLEAAWLAVWRETREKGPSRPRRGEGITADGLTGNAP